MTESPPPTSGTLLPAGHTPAERSLEASIERASALPVPLRALWTPETCPEALLPWLAWALALDGWKDYWPVAIKRQRLRDAVTIARHKGTVQSVRQAVTPFGSALAMREWFDQSPPGIPHSVAFQLTLGADVPNTAAYQEDIVREIVRTKPCRTQFTLTAGLQAMGSLGVQGIGRPATSRRLIGHIAATLEYQLKLGVQGIARPIHQRRLTTEEHP